MSSAVRPLLIGLALGLTMAAPAIAAPVQYPVVVAYHQFVENESRLEANMPVMLISQFEEQLQELQARGVRTLTMAEYVAAISRPDPPQDAVLITIDDSYESVYTMVYPLLQKYDMHATAFAITSRVGKSNVINPHQPWLTWEQCEEMQTSGVVDIEAHAENSHEQVLGIRNGNEYSGPYLTTHMVDAATGEPETDAAYNARIFDELRTVKRRIDEALRKDVQAFCWPYGASSAETRIAAREAGYAVTFRLEGEEVVDGDRLRLHSPENWAKITKLVSRGSQAGLAATSIPTVPTSGYTIGATSEPVVTPEPVPTPQASPEAQASDTPARRAASAVLAMAVGGLFWGFCSLVLYREPRSDERGPEGSAGYDS